MKTSKLTRPLLAAALLALALPATGFAQTLITDPVEGRIQDTNSSGGAGDGLGDSVGGSTAALIAGDATNNNQFRSAFEFNITSAAIKLAITNAPTTGGVFYSITVTEKTGTPSDLLLVGYSLATDANNTIAASDFQAAGTTFGTSFSSSTTVPSVFQVDVTAFAWQ